MIPVFHAPIYGIPAIPQIHAPALDEALTRYYVAKGLADVDVHGELLVPLATTAMDKAQHAQLLNGYVSDENIIAFMQKVSGLPRVLCAVRNYLDNIELTRQGAQPEEVLAECYEYTLEIIEQEGAKV